MGSFGGPYSSFHHVPGSGSAVSNSSTYILSCPSLHHVQKSSSPIPQSFPSQTAGKENSQESTYSRQQTLSLLQNLPGLQEGRNILPCLGLSRLNKYLVVPHFKIESIQSIALGIVEPSWQCCQCQDDPPKMSQEFWEDIWQDLGGHIRFALMA